MDQEPGKAGESVPAAPHPNDVPKFEPGSESENRPENGWAPEEPHPTPPAAPPVPPVAPAISAGANEETHPPDAAAFAAAPTPTPVVEPIAPEPGKPGADEPDAVEPPGVSSFSPEPASTEPEGFELPTFAPSAPGTGSPETESFEPAVPEGLEFDPATTGDDPLDLRAEEASSGDPDSVGDLDAGPTAGGLIAAAAPPPPVVVSAWGPPPPAWPPPVAPQSTLEDGVRAPGTPPPAGAIPLPGVQPVSEEPYLETGPNWMLSFVCLWAAGTALNEAWYLAAQVGLTPALVRNVTVMGYGVLGLGFIGFALDALQSEKRQSVAASILRALVPDLITLAGVILLELSNDPGRRI